MKEKMIEYLKWYAQNSGLRPDECGSIEDFILCFFMSIQPERSKREDDRIERTVLSLKCKDCEKMILYIDEPDRKTVLCRCGALNNRETD